MKKLILLLLCMISLSMMAKEGSKADFIEYDLDNGLHVILFQDKSATEVVVGVKYHVGSKNEEADRTGFAHFFEHLQFHGTKNIPQGEFENLVMTAGGYCNAYTNYDVTYYYEFFPAHDYKKGIWMEAERMLHPIITQEGIDRERNIVKEEKRMRYDNKPLGNAFNEMMEALYDSKTYGHSMIGSMEDLDAASLSDFQDFFDKYYAPNNACLVLAGNIDIDDSKKWIKEYFADIPRGKKFKRPSYFGKPSGKEKIIEKTIKGLKNTSMSMSFYCMPQTHKDAYTMNVISTILSGNKDYALLDKNVMEGDTTISHISAINYLWENVGFINIKTRFKKEGFEKEVQKKIFDQLELLKEGKISQHLLDQVINKYELDFTDAYFHNETLADMITNYHLLYGSAKEFNNVISYYKSITLNDVKRVANKYFNQKNCTSIIYYPEK